MSLISVLRAILTFVFFFSCMGALTAPVLAWMAITEDIFGHFNFIEKNAMGETVYAVLVISMVAGYFLFVGMIYFLKKAAYSLTTKNMISPKLQLSFHRAGWLCILGALFFKLPQLIVDFIIMPLTSASSLNSGVRLSFLPDSLLVLIALGLFLIIQARIMAHNLQLQEEAKLTI